MSSSASLEQVILELRAASDRMRSDLSETQDLLYDFLAPPNEADRIALAGCAPEERTQLFLERYAALKERRRIHSLKESDEARLQKHNARLEADKALREEKIRKRNALREEKRREQIRYDLARYEDNVALLRAEIEQWSVAPTGN